MAQLFMDFSLVIYIHYLLQLLCFLLYVLWHLLVSLGLAVESNNL